MERSVHTSPPPPRPTMQRMTLTSTNCLPSIAKIPVSHRGNFMPQQLSMKCPSTKVRYIMFVMPLFTLHENPFAHLVLSIVETAKSGRSKCEVCKKNFQRAAIADYAAADNDTGTAIVASAATSSSRAKTKKSTAMAKVEDPTLIEKGAIRCGSINLDTGSYGRFHRLGCWTVPKKVQNALTNSSDEKTSLRDLLAIVSMLFFLYYYIMLKRNL